MLFQVLCGRDMAVRKCTVDLFYDVISPYSYIAFEVLTRCNKKWSSMDLQLKPAFINGIMQASENQPPGMLPARARYMVADLHRISSFYEVPFNLPTNIGEVMFVKGSLKAQRLITAARQAIPDSVEELSRQIYLRIWCNDLDITEKDSLREACTAAGLSAAQTDELFNLVTKDEVKEALKKVTAEVVDHGAFGLPTYIFDKDGKKEMLFGTDRLFLLANYLGEPWPVRKS